jgi:hypothetical protein
VSESFPALGNDDGQVNGADLAIVKASFGKKLGQPGFDSRADVNKGGVVNILDLRVVGYFEIVLNSFATAVPIAK